jgi:phosphate transport system permease protein
MTATPGTVRGAAAGGRPGRSGVRWQVAGDRLFAALSLLAALVVPSLAVLMVVVLVRQSLPSIERFGWHFLVGRNWDAPGRELGALPFIYGTVVTSLVAMALAVPLGVGAAAYLSEVAVGAVRRAASFLIELLAAIPSVIYGFWGLEFLVPIFQRLFPWMGLENTTGKGYFTAGLLLAIMVVPYITAITFDVCRAVPMSQRQAGLALGATRWQLIWSVVLPYARGGIVGACFLALGRALGETMAVAMLIGNDPVLSPSLFGRGYSIAAVIANQLGTPENDIHRAALVELGLVLFLVTVVVNTLARVLIHNMAQPRGLRRWFGKTAGATVAAGPEPAGEVVQASAAEAPPRAAPLVSRLRNPLAAPLNRFMTVVLGLSLLVILLPLFHILAYVTLAGIRDLNLAFFTHLPSDDPPGLGHALLGTALMVALASAAAVPIGILGGLFLTEYRRHPLAPVARFIGEVLGGVPSVVLGVVSYALLVLRFGASAWAGAFALAVMMVPVVLRSSEEALKLVPRTLRDASYALGASHWQTVARVIVPSALPAIITGVFLAIARIAGETAPLLFTARNYMYWPQSLNEPTPFLTYYIYYGALGETNERLAWEGAVVLLAFVMLINVGIRLVTGRRVVMASRAD